MFPKIIFVVFSIFFSLAVYAQTYADSPSDFFFSKEVGEQPRMMSLGFISTGMDEAYGSLGPEGDEFYYCIRRGISFSVIVATFFSDGFWSYPEVLAFSGNYLDSSPFVSPDGAFLYFTSNRPESETDKIENWNIWRCRRLTDGSWGKPELLPFCLEDRNELSVSVDIEGNVYFSADYEGSTISLDRNFLDIYCVKAMEKGAWSKPERLGGQINTKAPEQGPAVSPDGNVLVFSSSRDGGFGSSDLYISFKRNGDWSQSLNLGSLVNSGGYQCCPSFSANGKWILFSATREQRKPRNIKYSQIKKWILGPGNGNGDIWYMAADSLSKINRP
jgi:hypothetical protein